MNKGNKVKCIKQFYPNAGYFGPYPEENKIYTIKEVCVVKGILGIMLEELFDMNNLTSGGGHWYYQADCFQLLDGPSDGTGRTNDKNNKPHFLDPYVGQERKPFYMQ